MGLLGRLLGGVAGLAMGGPVGAMMGQAVGHAAEASLRGEAGADILGGARVAGLFARPEETYALCVVVLAAKLAKVDGPVNRTEIDAFKRAFPMPPEAAGNIGRLFDTARDSAEGYAGYADQLGTTFAAQPWLMEDVLAALFAIARADRPVVVPEHRMLLDVARRLGIGESGWNRAQAGAPRGLRPPARDEPDAYAVLGVSAKADDTAVRAAWVALMRTHHPDSVAAKGGDAAAVEAAGVRVARINAAWDRIKRERAL